LSGEHPNAPAGGVGDLQRLPGRLSLPRVTGFPRFPSRTQVGWRRLESHVDRIDCYVGLFAEDTRSNSILPAPRVLLVAVDVFSQALTNPLLAPNVSNRETFSPLGREMIEAKQTPSDVLHANTLGPSRSSQEPFCEHDPPRLETCVAALRVAGPVNRMEGV
jgi:hypothetical protein